MLFRLVHARSRKRVGNACWFQQLEPLLEQLRGPCWLANFRSIRVVLGDSRCLGSGLFREPVRSKNYSLAFVVLVRFW